jgi:hypothetical protein
MFLPLSEAMKKVGEVVQMWIGMFLDLKANMRKAHDIAQTKLKAAQKVKKRDYDVKVRGPAFGVGDLVYWRRNVKRKWNLNGWVLVSL